MASASVLIVDDYEPDRYLLRRDLRKAGIEVEVFEASDGHDALEMLSSSEDDASRLDGHFPPNIIFLDINMPRVDGFAFLDAFAELRTEREALQSCVIMMFSSSEHPDDRQRALSREFVRDYIVKGQTSTDELKDKVEAALGPRA